MKIIPVIMAGGAGTRLWPLSKQEKPKQFHNFSGKGTLLEETINRIVPLNPEQILIVTSINYADKSKFEIKKSGLKGTVLSEPVPRNTAPAVLYSALYLDKTYNDSMMIILPADHYIKNNDEFINVLKSAIDQAENDNLVTIGIKPTYPETGYGYIKAGDKISHKAFKIDRFEEKPGIELAKKYFESGSYFWNSGIFIWKTSTILKSFRKLLPEHVKSFMPLQGLKPKEISSNNSKFLDIKTGIFNSLKPISIDYGILENADNRVTIPGDFGWSDLGSWKSIDDILNPLDNNNRAPEPDKALFVNSENCSVFTKDSRISVVGLKNVTIVQSGNEILVIDKESSQDVRKVVDKINKEK